MSEKKMITAAKNWDTIAKACGGIFRACGFVCVVFAVLVLIFKNKMYEVGSFSLDLGFAKFYLSDEYQAANSTIIVMTVISLVLLSAVLFIVSYGIRQLRDILAPMKEGRPFEEKTPRSIRNIAWAVLAGGGILQVLSLAESFLLTKAYPFEEIFSSDYIDRIEFAYNIDFGFVLVFCGVMFLSYIFSYGQKLQQESDETL